MVYSLVWNSICHELGCFNNLLDHNLLCERDSHWVFSRVPDSFWIHPLGPTVICRCWLLSKYVTVGEATWVFDAINRIHLLHHQFYLSKSVRGAGLWASLDVGIANWLHIWIWCHTFILCNFHTAVLLQPKEAPVALKIWRKALKNGRNMWNFLFQFKNCHKRLKMILNPYKLHILHLCCSQNL